MLRIQTILKLIYCLFACGAIAQLAYSAVPSDHLLPAETKGYVSITRFEEFGEKFDRTQIGQLLLDESMQPFRQDFRRQMDRQFDAVTDKLGVRLEDFAGITGGEFSLALIHREGRSAAMAIVIDVTDRARSAEQLIAKAEQEFTRRGGRKEVVDVAGQELTVFHVPAPEGQPEQQTIYFHKDDTLCIIDDRAEAEAMLARFAGRAEDSLSTVPAFQATMNRCGKEAGDLAPELRWFVEPFEFVWAWRTLEHDHVRLDKDIVQILHDNGFDAVQGTGGYLNLLADENMDFMYRIFIYAPPVAGKENDPLRWNLSMQMMQLPNVESLTPEAFVPKHCASYSTMNADIVNAYNHVHHVADDLIGYEDAFKTTIEGLEIDPYGPEIKVKDEFIAHLGTRASVLRDYLKPVTPECERYVYAIEAIDPVKLAMTLDKIMDNDPAGKQQKIDNTIVWVIEEEQHEFDDFAGLGFGPLGGDGFGPPAKKNTGVLQNSAACVSNGYLLLASDIKFLKQVLENTAPGERLTDCEDYQKVEAAIRQLADGPLSGWSFARSGESLRPTYELTRHGLMPQAKTSFARLLNELMTTEVEEEEGVPRKQRLDGSKLPAFDSIEEFFGPAGNVIHSEDDGWLLTGGLMR